MIHNHTGFISDNNALSPLPYEEKCAPFATTGHHVSVWHTKSKEEKLTTILIIISIISLLLTF
jgi:hypothetical protein